MAWRMRWAVDGSSRSSCRKSEPNGEVRHGRGGRDGGRAPAAVGEEGDLAEEVALAERPEIVALARDRRVAVLDDEERVTRGSSPTSLSPASAWRTSVQRATC